MAEDILPGKYKKMKNGKFELGHTCACYHDSLLYKKTHYIYNIQSDLNHRGLPLHVQATRTGQDTPLA